MKHRLAYWAPGRDGKACAVCECGRRFVAMNGELAHQLLERHVAAGDEAAA